MQTGSAVHNTDQKQGTTMNSNSNHGNSRKEKRMIAITKATSFERERTMKPIATCLTVLATLVAAAFTGSTVWAAENVWTLKTDDTHLVLAVRENKLFIEELKNPAKGWNWTPKPSQVPLMERVIVGKEPRPLTWSFREATTASATNGTTLTLRFTSADPALELKSIWRAWPGVGPVEHHPTIRNDTAGAVSFADADLVAAQLDLVSDQAAHLFPVATGRLGYGESNPLPFQMIQVGTVHGIYLAYDYGCGEFATTVTNNQIASRWWAAGIINAGAASRETFRCPGMMIQAYQGDEDDGANRFRRWFWRYEITRSLYENANEPPICIGYWPPPDGMGDYLIREVKRWNFPAMGIGLLKTDAWHMSSGHERSPELVDICHANGMQVNFYWNKPRAEEVLAKEWQRSKFDGYRTDSGPFRMEDYRSFMDFNRKMDSLSQKYGIKWENCSNGGKLRSLDVCRRMTFMTHSDNSGLHQFFDNVYRWSYLIPPIQLKSDNLICGAPTVAHLRQWLLGAIQPFLNGSGTEVVNDSNFVSKLDDIKRVFHLYNTRQRPILRGADVYRILPPPPTRYATGQWMGIQYYNTFINRGSVLLWRNGGPASQVVKLKGLDRGATYQVTFEDAKDKSSSRTGAQLMDEGLDVPMGPNASEVIWLNCPELSTTPGDLDIRILDRADKPAAKQLTLAYSRGPGADKEFSVTCAAAWVKIAPVAGAGNGQTFAVSVDPSGQADGIHCTKVVVSREDLPDRIEVPVRLRLGKAAPLEVVINSFNPTIKWTVYSHHVVPPSYWCMLNREVPFSATVYDQFGEPIEARIQWSVAGGGKISDQGVFSSDARGTVAVTATVAGHASVAATMSVRVLPPVSIWWKLDDKDGNTAKDDWGDKTGTLVGGPTWEAGKRGGALRFNGKGQYVDPKWSAEELELPCTFAFWVNPADTQCESAGIFGGGVLMQQQGKELNKYSFAYGSTPVGSSAGPVQLTANEWQHVAAVCDGKEVVLYLNGKEVARGIGKSPIMRKNPYMNFVLGTGRADGRYFNGALDDFRIYSRALTAAEVADLARETDKMDAKESRK